MNDPIAQKMKEGVLAGVFPGGVLLVHHRGRIVFHKAFGSASLTPKRKSMTCSTLFDLASLTKPLATSAALALLLQRRCLALSDPLSRFIRGFKSGEKGGITLFHLLNHASGLPDWRPYYQVIAKRGEKEKGFVGSDAAKEAIYRMAHREPLISAPGTESRYSDIGFILLGEVIEKVGGEPLHRFCYRHLFSKINRQESYFVNRGRRPPAYRRRSFAATELSSWRGKVICGTVHDDNAYAMGGIAGHAGLFSTAREVYRLVRFWLDALKGEGILDPSLTALFVTRQKGRGVPAQSSWGLGWDTPSHPSTSDAPPSTSNIPPSSSGRYFSSASFGHLGFTGTSIWVDRARDLAVILLTNRIHPSRANEKIRSFRPALHDVIFKEVAGG